MYAIVKVYDRTTGEKVAVLAAESRESLEVLTAMLRDRVPRCSFVSSYPSVAVPFVINPVVLREWHMRSWLASHGGTWHPYRDQWRILQ